MLEFSKYSTTSEVESMIKLSEEGIEATYVKNGQVRSRFAMEDDKITIDSGSLTFNSGTLIINSKKFTLDSSGNASFGGNLDSPTGTIGGWTIGSRALYNGPSSMDSYTNGVYLGTDGIYEYYDGQAIRLQEARIEIDGTTYSSSDWVGIKITQSNSTITLDSGIEIATGSRWSRVYDFGFLTGYGSSSFFSVNNSGSDVTVNMSGTFAVNGTIIAGSDESLKTDISALSVSHRDYEKVIETLEPVTFEYKAGGKQHIGFTYQNAVKALEAGGVDPDDCAMVDLIKDPDTGEEYGGIEYNDIIALLVYEVQKLKLQVENLNA